MTVKTFTPTQAVLNNIQRGVVLKNKYSRQSIVAQNNKTQIAKAKESFDQGFTLDVVKNMYYVLSNLEESVDFKKVASDGGPTEEVIKFYAHGGSAGLAWSRMILKQEGILKSYKKEVSKEEIEAEGTDRIGKIPVTKALNEELMQVTYVAMLPDHTDLHGDYTSEEEVRKAKESFNKSLMKANLFHMVMTDSFEVIESYLSPCDMILNEIFVKKGTWLMTLQIHDETLWQMIKDEEINGISIGAVASVETMEDE